MLSDIGHKGKKLLCFWRKNKKFNSGNRTFMYCFQSNKKTSQFVIWLNVSAAPYRRYPSKDLIGSKS